MYLLSLPNHLSRQIFFIINGNIQWRIKLYYALQFTKQVRWLFRMKA